MFSSFSQRSFVKQHKAKDSQNFRMLYSNSHSGVQKPAVASLIFYRTLLSWGHCPWYWSWWHLILIIYVGVNVLTALLYLCWGNIGEAGELYHANFILTIKISLILLKLKKYIISLLFLIDVVFAVRYFRFGKRFSFTFELTQWIFMRSNN